MKGGEEGKVIRIRKRMSRDIFREDDFRLDATQYRRLLNTARHSFPFFQFRRAVIIAIPILDLVPISPDEGPATSDSRLSEEDVI